MHNRELCLACIDELAHKYEDRSIRLLESLVSCETTDYKESGGQKIVADELSGLGFRLAHIRPEESRLSSYPEFNSGHAYDEERACVVGIRRGTGGGRSLSLNAHVDTVFPSDPPAWRTDPFKPVISRDALYGLGACDTKGGMAAMLTALRIVGELPCALRGDLIFESVVDEEAGGGNGSLACIDAGYRADAVLVAEPTSLMPACTHTGSCAFRLTVEGKSSHANIKAEGVSAFEKAFPILSALRGLEHVWQDRTDSLLPAPVISVLEIRMGDGSITLPGKCEILVNYTYLPDGYPYHEEIMRVIRETAGQDPWFSEHPIAVEPVHDVRPYRTPPDGGWALCTAGCASRVLGRRIDPSGFPCGADARLYANVGNMPCVILGPGDIRNAHRPNEFVLLEEFFAAVRLYAHIIYDWCG